MFGFGTVNLKTSLMKDDPEMGLRHVDMWMFLRQYPKQNKLTDSRSKDSQFFFLSGRNMS